MQHVKVMAVDDDPTNLEIMTKNLKDAGFESIGFEDGDVAWGYLSQNPEDVDVVLLDKMMPRMNGMEVLKNMKSHKLLRNVPVILQTGDTGSNETREGLAAGAYYYLEKPFDPEVMVAVVNAATREHRQHDEVRRKIKQEKSIASLLRDGRFRYKTIEEARKLAAALAYHATNSDEISVALAEIMVNAVEHGNLNIGYDRKNSLMAQNLLEQEVRERMNSPENINKVIFVRFQRESNYVIVTVKDEGQGFDWEKFMEFDPARLTDLNGRGIATANLMGMQIEYRDNGSTVECRFEADNS